MTTIKIRVSDEILSSFHENTEELAQDVKVYAAVEMYRLRKLSSGKAAELAGIPRIKFIEELERHNVLFSDISEKELEKDIENAEKYGSI